MSYSVKNDRGEYLGRYDQTKDLDWVPPAFAYCYDTAEQCADLARLYGGSVVPAPRWDRTIGRYV